MEELIDLEFTQIEKKKLAALHAEIFDLKAKLALETQRLMKAETEVRLRNKTISALLEIVDENGVKITLLGTPEYKNAISAAREAVK